MFDNATGREIFTWMNGMVKDGLATTNRPRVRASSTTCSASEQGLADGDRHRAALGTITAVLSTGEDPTSSSGWRRCPVRPKAAGGVLVEGGALFMVNKSAPAKQAAAWKFLKFLDEPETQANVGRRHRLHADPEVVGDRPTMQDFWAKNPGYKVAYDQLLAARRHPATAAR